MSFSTRVQSEVFILNRYQLPDPPRNRVDLRKEDNLCNASDFQ